MLLAIFLSTFASALEGKPANADNSSFRTPLIFIAVGFVAFLVALVSFTCLWWKKHKTREELAAEGKVCAISTAKAEGSGAPVPKYNSLGSAHASSTASPGSPRTSSANSPDRGHVSSGNASGSPRASTGNASGSPRASTGNASGSPRASTGNASGSPRASTDNASGSPRASSGNASGSPRASTGNASGSPRASTGNAPGSPRASTDNASGSPRASNGNASGGLSASSGTLTKLVNADSSQSDKKCASDLLRISHGDKEVTPGNTVSAPLNRSSQCEASLSTPIKPVGPSRGRPHDMLRIPGSVSGDHRQSSRGSCKSTGSARDSRTSRIRKVENDKVVVPEIVLVPGTPMAKLPDDVKAGIPLASRTRSRSVLHIGWYRGMVDKPPALRQSSLPSPRRKIISPITTRAAVDDGTTSLRMSDVPASFSKVSAPVRRRRCTPSEGTLRMSDMPPCFATISGKLLKEEGVINMADLPPSFFKIENANEPRPGTDAMLLSELSASQMRISPAVSLTRPSVARHQRALAHVARAPAKAKQKALHKSGSSADSARRPVNAQSKAPLSKKYSTIQSNRAAIHGVPAPNAAVAMKHFGGNAAKIVMLDSFASTRQIPAKDDPEHLKLVPPIPDWKQVD